MSGPRLRALAGEILQGLLQGGVDGQPVHAPAGLGGDDLIGGMRRQQRQRLARMRHCFQFGAGNLVARRDAGRPWRCGRARGRAPPAPRRPNGPAGAVPAIAAARPGARLRRATGAWAPCRNRRARPRGCLRGCRHRAPASGRAKAPRPCSSCARSRWRARSGEAWRRACVRRAAPTGAPPAWSGRAAGDDHGRWRIS